MKDRIELVDFLKGFAITAIVTMHFLEEYNLPRTVAQAVQFGGAGVHVFFLCSGFGLFLSHLKNPMSYTDFLRKRFKKVYLPYAIIVTSIAVWDVAILGEWGHIGWELLSHLLLFKMFIESYNLSLCPTFWFVSTIFQFYLFWPIIVWLYKKKNSLLYTLLISIIWMALMDNLRLADNRVWGSCLLQYLWEFVLGMRIADSLSQKKTIIIPQWMQLAACMTIGLGGMFLFTILFPVFKPYNDFFSFLSICSLAIILYKSRNRRIKIVFIYVSRMAYEWYLVHYSIFLICWTVIGGRMLFMLEILMLFTLSWIGGMLYHQMIKRIA